MRRGRQNRIDNKVQDRYHWLIYFYVENLIFGRHFSSVLSPCMCCTYTNVFCTHFCHLIRSVSGEMSIGHLVEGSDDWKYIYTSVSSEISTWMLKKFFFVLEFDFCRSTSAFKCEAHILRFTVIFFVFLKQNRAPFHKNDSMRVFNRLKKSSQLDLNSWLLAHISADAVQTALTRHSLCTLKWTRSQGPYISETKTWDLPKFLKLDRDVIFHDTPVYGPDWWTKCLFPRKW